MSQPRPPAQTTPRVARHRRKLTGIGAQRVEITVPLVDAPLIRDIAAILRAGGEGAQRVRDRLQPILQPRIAGTGQELVAFFQASPLCCEDLLIERDKSTGRQVDL
ncbi:MAG: hypothetical protein WCF85_15800 [Rhodospirillaceae bacterium]